MTRPLRRAHLLVWLVLPALLFGLLAAGVWSRRVSTPINHVFSAEDSR